MAALQESRPHGPLLGVAADRGERKTVIDYAKQLGIDFPIWFDSDGTVRERYEVIGRDGKFDGRVIGFRDWTSAGAFAPIEEPLYE